jgi:RNA polymerase sigma-70 factor, ECF subfamily
VRYRWEHGHAARAAILLNVHRHRSRRSWWRRLLPLEALADEPAAPDRALELEGAERVAHALATLAPTHREAIVLFELEGWNIEEIAEMQRTSTSAVKSRLSRARARLRRHYQRGERGLEPVLEEKAR